MHQLDNRIGDLVNLGEEMVHEGHFDADNIIKASKITQDKFADLREPTLKRREALEESLRFHKFGFELDSELQWIREHLPLASSEKLGQNLHQAQSLYKKHRKLEAEIDGHQPMIDRTLASGEALVQQAHPEIKQALELELDTYSGIVNEMGHTAAAMVNAKHPDAKVIAARQQLISQQMRTLQRLATSRQQRLMESMYRHEYFQESAELEQWIKEQVQTAASEDYGQDYEHLIVSDCH
uniref:Spectrin alpha chain-like protein n=1 Tax=Timema cristinae TaxID=61476 RepID=A0A7R9GQT6_TIMCR|nr:unnamed protein product [Timema cristinae]